MRVVVCGSRDFTDRAVVWQFLDGIYARQGTPNDPLVIIDGVCPYGGADQFGYEWQADKPFATSERFPPANRPGWDRPTSYEFLARNRAMIDSGADLCIAFVNKPLENSRGTHYTVNYARQHGVKTIVIEVR